MQFRRTFARRAVLCASASLAIATAATVPAAAATTPSTSTHAAKIAIKKDLDAFGHQNWRKIYYSLLVPDQRELFTEHEMARCKRFTGYFTGHYKAKFVGRIYFHRGHVYGHGKPHLKKANARYTLIVRRHDGSHYSTHSRQTDSVTYESGTWWTYLDQEEVSIIQDCNR